MIRVRHSRACVSPGWHPDDMPDDVRSRWPLPLPLPVCAFDICPIHDYALDMDEAIRVTREQVDAIGQGIADLSLRIDVAKHELLTQLRKFDTHDGWANSGFLSLAAWLAWRIDIGPVAAREYVRVARALGELTRVDARLLGRGRPRRDSQAGS